VSVAADGATDGSAQARELMVDGVRLDAVVLVAWDPVTGRAVPAFSGIDAEGVVWSGVKTVRS
jgi:hypothetical protein